MDVEELNRRVAKLQSVLRNRDFSQVQPMSKILDFLYLGDVDSAQPESLTAQDVSSVLNMAAADTCMEDGRQTRDGVQYLCISAEDEEEYPLLDAHFEACCSFLDECASQGRRVLVHCMAGVNRSASIVVAYLMRRRGMHLLSAVRHAFTARPIILSNAGFVEQLVQFASDNNCLGPEVEWDALSAPPPGPPPPSMQSVHEWVLKHAPN
mmetsp:Transcript_44644/g.96747  ORF Transcript_44644/g.96747 Transcript_44644/m.96747 type:complete len:209 (+) Transcript_44644:1-627(+)